MSNPLSALLGPACDRVGQVLGGMMISALGSLNNFAYYAEVDKLILKKNLEALEKEYEKKEKADLVSPIPEIAVPVLERLRYISNEEISKAFVNLLVNASTISGARLAHPGFIRIIDSLSADEAKVLRRFSEGPIYRLYVYKRSVGGLNEQMKGLVMTGIEYELNLDFPENATLYFDNLYSLGLYIHDGDQSKDENLVNTMLNYYNLEIETFMGRPTMTGVGDPKDITVNLLPTCLTSFGKKFMEACLPT